MSQDIRNAMKRDLEALFNDMSKSLSNEKWGKEPAGYPLSITAFKNVVEAYVKLDELDHKITADKNAIDAMKKNSNPINWRT